MKRQSVSDLSISTIIYFLVAMLAAATLFPFWNLLAVSLNDSLDTLKGHLYLWPRRWTLSNYHDIIENRLLFSAALRSVFRTVVGTGLGIFCTAMFAYALSTREFIFRKQLNLLLVITLYVNGGLIPTYLLIKNLHLINNFLVYLLPVLINAFFIIIVRSYFESLPAGLIESAKIDGAGHFQILFRIVLPISMPVIATITLFVAVMHWNSWFDNYLYASRNESLSLLQYELMKILLSAMNQQAGQTAHVDETTIRAVSPESIRAAMTMVVTVPILLVYPFLQRYFIKGMTIGSMKE